MSSKIITIPEAQNALQRSGYLLENRVATELEKQGSFVESNSAIPDPITGKSRELDVFGIGAFPMYNYEWFLYRVFLIECVNNPQPVTFFPKNTPISFTFNENLIYSGIPEKIISTADHECEWISFSEFLNLDRYHHYCCGEFSTQFCTFQEKRNNSEWMAFHEEKQYDSFQKLCMAAEYHRERHFSAWNHKLDKNEPFRIEIFIPLIIFQGDLFKADIQANSLSLKKAKHINFLYNQIYHGNPKTYHIDVISEDYFPAYLEMIEHEFQKMVRRIKNNKKLIRASIDKIAWNVTRGENASEKRKALSL